MPAATTAAAAQQARSVGPRRLRVRLRAAERAGGPAPRVPRPPRLSGRWRRADGNPNDSLQIRLHLYHGRCGGSAARAAGPRLRGAARGPALERADRARGRVAVGKACWTQQAGLGPTPGLRAADRSWGPGTRGLGTGGSGTVPGG